MLSGPAEVLESLAGVAQVGAPLVRQRSYTDWRNGMLSHTSDELMRFARTALAPRKLFNSQKGSVALNIGAVYTPVVLHGETPGFL